MRTPVIVVGYNRAGVISRSLRNLVQCTHIADHPVYVYIDGARSNGDIADVSLVLDVVRNIKRDYLPQLTLVDRPCNYGCRENILQAVCEVLEKHGRMCLIEDDVLVSRTFLDYMDGALDFYQGDQRIFNINGYQPRYLRIPRRYAYDVYLDLRNHTPGWGIWRDRWERIDFDLKDWKQFKSCQTNCEKVNKAGIDLMHMLDLQADNPRVLNAWDVQCTYHMIKNGLYSIEPRFSLTKNIGFGMKSEHCSGFNPLLPTQKYYNFMPRFQLNVCPDDQIVSQFRYISRDPRFAHRVLRKLHRMLLRFSPQFWEPIDLI